MAGDKNEVLDYRLALTDPVQLFDAGVQDPFDPQARVESGVDEVVDHLMGHPLPDRVRLILELSRDPGPERGADQIRVALNRQCELRRNSVDRQLALRRREGLAALPTGVVLFAIGLFLSFELTRQHIPEDVRLLLGDGVFLVLGWVGLWYPLDTLVFASGELRRRRRALRLLGRAEVLVLAP